MVRRRGRPRRSYAYLRIKRYRLKWTHKVIPQSFKLLVRPMEAKIETKLKELDFLEIQVFAALQELGVAQAEWKNYMAFAKRCYHAWITSWYDTAFKEEQQLREEFITRGLVADVLDYLIGIVRYKAEIFTGNPQYPPLGPSWCDGFETGDWSKWDYAYGALEVVANPVYEGSYALQYCPTAGVCNPYSGVVTKDLAGFDIGTYIRLHGYVWITNWNYALGTTGNMMLLGFVNEWKVAGAPFDPHYMGDIIAGFGLRSTPTEKRGYLALCWKPIDDWWQSRHKSEIRTLGKWYEVCIDVKRHATEGWIKIYLDQELYKEEYNRDTILDGNLHIATPHTVERVFFSIPPVDCRVVADKICYYNIGNFYREPY